jgi:hypothetical protein
MPIGGTAFFGQNQSPRITTNYLNQASRQGDPAPGVNVSTEQVSGSIVQPYSGFCGGKLTVTGPWATAMADPTVGPLYGGIYMYCQLDPSVLVAPIRGQVMFWADEENYVVTTVGSVQPAKVAGIAVNPTLPGYWDFFQVAGIASVRFTAAVGFGIMVATNPAQLPAVGITATGVDKNYLGMTVLSAALANSVSPVQLNIMAGYNF